MVGFAGLHAGARELALEQLLPALVLQAGVALGLLQVPRVVGVVVPPALALAELFGNLAGAVRLA